MMIGYTIPRHGTVKKLGGVLSPPEVTTPDSFCAKSDMSRSGLYFSGLPVRT